MKRSTVVFSFGVTLFSIFSCQNTSKTVTASTVDGKVRPNVIFILADDMGIGDISALNPEAKVHTPHIDSLIAKGKVFSDAHSSSAVCTPSRYSIMTGEYAWRSRLKRGVTWGYSKALIDSSKPTLPKLFKKNGYFTAAIGKWHLGWDWAAKEETVGPWDNPELRDPAFTGENVAFDQPITNGPTDIGFDYFYGIPASLDMKPYCYVENNRVQHLPMRMIAGSHSDSLGLQWRDGLASTNFKHEDVLDQLTAKAIHTIDKGNEKKSPFFLYYALTAPHTPWLPSKVHLGKSEAGLYGDFVQMVDATVGQIIAKVKTLGIEENTIIVFTSDNGALLSHLNPSYAHSANGNLRGQKADIFEGGHRIPLVVSWPTAIEAQSSSDQLVCLMDFYATFQDLLQESIAKNGSEARDSKSFLNVLTGGQDNADDAIRTSLIHHSSRGIFAIRQGNVKLIEGLGSGGFTLPHTIAPDGRLPYQVFQMDTDPEEQQDLMLSQEGYEMQPLLDSLNTIRKGALP